MLAEDLALSHERALGMAVIATVTVPVVTVTTKKLERWPALLVHAARPLKYTSDKRSPGRSG